MPFANTPRDRNRVVNDQLLDVSKITDGHEWDISAQSNISFRHTVEENSYPRADAQRYKLIADVNLEGARGAFSRACSSTTLFKIPPTIICDRSFARDAHEAYYVDAMHFYLLQPFEELRVEDIPLLKGPLHNRYFCSFARRPVYFTEIFERRRLGHWIPGDSPDLEFFSDLQKASWFPKVDQWIMILSQPCALPIPLPFVVYYFHIEIRNAQRYPAQADSERVRRLMFCLEHEYMIFFLAVWWNELYYGGRAFVIKQETINVLQAKCGTLSDIAGKPAQAIIERMRMYADMPQRHHNWMCFRDRELEPSAFIFAVKKVGVPDHAISSGRRLWCRRDHRAVSVSRYTSETYRRLALMDERLSDPDLDDVPGLLSLVKEQEWTRYTSIRVSELLHHMLALYVSTRSKLDETQRQTRQERRVYDDLKEEFDLIRDELHCCKNSLEDTRYQLESSHNRHEEVCRKLDDALREIQHLKQNGNGEAHCTTPRRVNPSANGHDGMQTPRSPEYYPSRDGNHDERMTSNAEEPVHANTRDASEDRVNSPVNASRVQAPIRPKLTRSMVEAAKSATQQKISLMAAQSTPGSSGNPTAISQPGSPSTRGRSLPKIKPGYLFFPMPKSKKSAQTSDKSSVPHEVEATETATPD